MESYGDDKTGVIGYALTYSGIILRFRNNELYLYDDVKPGKEHVEQMKRLAETGKGLTTYVTKHVRDNYRTKLE
ncbi:MAG TPA: hypothetical protein VL093_13955 [Flavipsychrobacter sp.]|nr:hypothetical protein [Flavipsychrobacter sp.]